MAAGKGALTVGKAVGKTALGAAKLAGKGVYGVAKFAYKNPLAVAGAVAGGFGLPALVKGVGGLIGGGGDSKPKAGEVPDVDPATGQPVWRDLTGKTRARKPGALPGESSLPYATSATGATGYPGEAPSYASGGAGGGGGMAAGGGQGYTYTDEYGNQVDVGTTDQPATAGFGTAGLIALVAIVAGTMLFGKKGRRAA